MNQHDIINISVKNKNKKGMMHVRTIRKKIIPTHEEKVRIDSKLRTIVGEEGYVVDNDLCVFFEEEDRYVEISVINPTSRRNAEVRAILRDMEDGGEIMRDISGCWKNEWHFIEGKVEYFVEIGNACQMFRFCNRIPNTEDQFCSSKVDDVKEILLQATSNMEGVELEMIAERGQGLKLRAVFVTNEDLFVTMEEDRILDILNIYFGTNFTSFFIRSDMPDTMFFVDSPKVQHYRLKLKSHEDAELEKEIVIQADHNPTPDEAWGFFMGEILEKLPMYHYVGSVNRITPYEYFKNITGGKWEKKLLKTEELPF